MLPLARRGRALTSLTNWHTPEFGPLAEDDEARSALVDAAVQRSSRLSLGFVAPEVADLVSGPRTLRRVQMRSPYVTLDDAHLAENPSKKRRKELDRCRRRLAEREGDVTLEVFFDTDHLDEAFELEASGWKRESGTAIVSDPTLVAFYTDVARWAAAEGTLRLCFLRAGERRVATELVLDDGVAYYDVKGGYDTDLREFSPGLLIAQDLIAAAHADGRATFELLGDAEQFKLTWTDDVRDRVLVQSFGATAIGAYAAQRFGRPLAKRLLRR